MLGGNIFKWSSEFETKIMSIDMDHKHLIDIINELGSKITDKDLNFAMVEPIFQELFDYTNYHFKSEEQMAAELKVDKRHIEEHKKAHKIFLQRISGLYDNLKSGEFKKSNFKELLDFLIYWLTFHILGMDQKLTYQIHAIKSGKIPEVAFDEINSADYSQINMLVKSFNGAFESLMKYNKELLDLKENLESQITNRTIELQKANEQLEQIAMYDYLTGLANRRKTMQVLEKCLEDFKISSEIFSIIMLDLDDFKFINDNYGHDNGDLILRELSRLIKENIRNDDIACRLGGDEFLVICQNTDLQGAKILATKLKDAINKAEFKFAGNIYKISTSIGVASWNADMTTIKDILKLVDVGLYWAKDGGKNQVVAQC